MGTTTSTDAYPYVYTKASGEYVYSRARYLVRVFPLVVYTIDVDRGIGGVADQSYNEAKPKSGIG